MLLQPTAGVVFARILQFISSGDMKKVAWLRHRPPASTPGNPHALHACAFQWVGEVGREKG